MVELINQEAKQWDIQKLSMFFEEEIVHEILAIPLSSFTGIDKQIWTGNKSGAY